MKWLLAFALVSGAVAIWLVSRTGEDDLSIAMAGDPDPRATTFRVSVELGCEGEELEDEITGHEIEETDDALIVSFTGKESDSADDCSYRVTREVDLDRPLGQRRICDGGTDPPEEIWGPGRPVPTPPATRGRYRCGEIDSAWPGFSKACGAINSQGNDLEVDITSGPRSIPCRMAREVMAEFVAEQPQEQGTARFRFAGEKWSCYVARPDRVGWDFHCNQPWPGADDRLIAIAAGRRLQPTE